MGTSGFKARKAIIEARSSGSKIWSGKSSKTMAIAQLFLATLHGLELILQMIKLKASLAVGSGISPGLDWKRSFTLLLLTMAVAPPTTSYPVGRVVDRQS